MPLKHDGTLDELQATISHLGFQIDEVVNPLRAY